MLFALICATAVLRTIAEALALPDAEFAADRPVEIEGLVTAVLRTDSHLIDDGTGRFIFEMADQSKPVRTGDVIRARGHTNLVLDDGMRQKSLIFDDYAITGRKPLPETPTVESYEQGKALQGQVLVVAPGTGETIDVDGDFIRKRDELFDEVSSRRQLEQMWFEFCGGRGEKSKGGRPKEEKTEFVMKPKEENSADIWAGIKADFEGPAAQKAVKYLNAEATTAVLDSLRRLVAKFEEHLAKISK